MDDRSSCAGCARVSSVSNLPEPSRTRESSTIVSLRSRVRGEFGGVEPSAGVGTVLGSEVPVVGPVSEDAEQAAQVSRMRCTAPFCSRLVAGPSWASWTRGSRRTVVAARAAAPSGYQRDSRMFSLPRGRPERADLPPSSSSHAASSRRPL